MVQKTTNYHTYNASLWLLFFGYFGPFLDSDSTEKSHWMPNNCIHCLFMVCDIGADGILSSVRKNTQKGVW